MSSDILLNLLLNPFFHVRAEEEVPVHAISLGLCENVEVSLAKQCSDLLSKTQPLYMKSFLLCVTWLQRGAVSRQPGNKIIAPVLVTCDEVDISWIFEPCASSCGADDLFGEGPGIVRYFNILSFNL